MTDLGTGVCIAAIETMLICAWGVAIPTPGDMMPMSCALAKLTPGAGCEAGGEGRCGDTRRRSGPPLAWSPVAVPEHHDYVSGAPHYPLNLLFLL